jgi:hypothetical protein
MINTHYCEHIYVIVLTLIQLCTHNYLEKSFVLLDDLQKFRKSFEETRYFSHFRNYEILMKWRLFIQLMIQQDFSCVCSNGKHNFTYLWIVVLHPENRRDQALRNFIFSHCNIYISSRTKSNFIKFAS